MIAPLAFIALMSGFPTPQVTPASVAVSTIGKSRAALRAELLSASEAVCRAELQAPLDAAEIKPCVVDTYDAALLKAKHVEPSGRGVIHSAQLVR